MKKLIFALSILLLTSCGSPTASNAVTAEAVRNAQRVMAEYNALADQHAQLTDEYQAVLRDNAALRERLVLAENMRVTLEAAARNSNRDNSTVNTLVRWNVFQWDVRIAVVSLVVAVVSLGALGFVVLRKTGVSEVEPRKWVFVADAKPFEWVDDAAN